MVRARMSDAFWHWRGEREVSLGEAVATFDTSKRIYTGTTARSVSLLHDTQSHVAEDLLGALRPDDVFYDVGAHIGFYSCIASSVLTAGEVHAFEPDRRDREPILANIERNHPGRTSHHPVLLSDENGEQHFGGESLADDEGDVVDVWRLDDYRAAHDLPAPTVVKIDIEGAELRALEGAEESLESVRACYVEVHDDETMRQFGDTQSDLSDFLEERGFAIVDLGRRGGEAHVKALKDTS